MIPSIRTFLLVNLLLSVTLITSFAVIGNLFLEHREVYSHLDAQLTMRALMIDTFMGNYPEQNLNALQKSINDDPTQLRQALQSADDFIPYETIQFLVWNKDGLLLLHTGLAPAVSLSALSPGLNDKWIAGEPWRVFVIKNPKTGITVMAGEKYELREELESKITQNSVLIMLVSYPFLGLMIWIIVGRGLAILKKVANELSHRAPGYLKPVDLESVPHEIKPLVDELNRLLMRLHEAFSREKRFAADAAHELRTPLAALKTQVQVALRASTNEERTESLRKVLAGVDRSVHVVQQLLTLSRMVPEALPNEFIPMNLSKQAAEIMADLVPEALSKGTELELISDPEDERLMINGIPTAIGILIRNLVDNAIRYTPEGSTVRVYVEHDDEHVILKVVDNGPGIPEELRERVFERFFRMLGNKTTGSGLGLGIVQQIAEIHQAKVTLNTPASGVGLEIAVAFMKYQFPVTEEATV